ncbi:MAG TPA: hypothetical protein VGC42_05175 [Kofleriaceae bacterium]
MIRALAGATVIAAALATGAAAAPRKVLVLPTEGSPDIAGLRRKITAQLAELARVDGQVTIGDATFADAAVAVGCDAKAAGCSAQVLATLGVDELVWATTRRAVDSVAVVVHRATKAGPARNHEIIWVPGGPDAEDAFATQLAVPFHPGGGEPAAAAALEPGPAPAPTAARPDDQRADHAADQDHAGEHATDRWPSDRNLGIAVGVGAGVALVLGAALWSSCAGLQDQIDQHATRTRSELGDLIALEDRAQTRAALGNGLFVAGLAAGGVAAYFLLRDHHHHAVAIAPAPIAHGGGVVLRGSL